MVPPSQSLNRDMAEVGSPSLLMGLGHAFAEVRESDFRWSRFSDTPAWHTEPNGVGALPGIGAAMAHDAWLLDHHADSGCVFERDGRFAYRLLSTIAWANDLAATPMLQCAHRLQDAQLRQQILECIDYICPVGRMNTCIAGWRIPSSGAARITIPLTANWGTAGQVGCRTLLPLRGLDDRAIRRRISCQNLGCRMPWLADLFWREWRGRRGKTGVFV